GTSGCVSGRPRSRQGRPVRRAGKTKDPVSTPRENQQLFPKELRPDNSNREPQVHSRRGGQTTTNTGTESTPESKAGHHPRLNRRQRTARRQARYQSIKITRAHPPRWSGAPEVS